MTTRAGSIMRVLRTSVVIIALLAGAAAGGTHIVQQRLVEQSFVDLGDAVLTAEPVTVSSTDSGIVADLLVTEQSDVAAGQELARITVPPTGTSKQPETRVLHAPNAGIVSAIHVRPGSVARSDEPVVTLYDQRKLTFQAPASVGELRRLRLGMTAYLDGPGVGTHIAATLDHVIPRVGNGSLSGDELAVVLVPETDEVERVSTLVPGLQFAAIVDTNTAAGAIPAVNSA